MTNYEYHTPVLLQQSVEALVGNSEGIYVDVTFGGGGHTAEILARLTAGKLVAFDQDADAEKNASRFEANPNFMFVKSNFAYVQNFLKLAEIEQVDGLLADLGVSSHQFDIPERGFSYREDALLDMRMNTSDGQTAADILNMYEAEELMRVFKVYGELHNARKLANFLVRKRAEKAIETTTQFNELITPFAPYNKEYKFLAKAYQALRIEVNQEMKALEKLLETCTKIVKEGGRIVFITYHSLEDRLVKNFIKTGSVAGVEDKDLYGNVTKPFEAVNKKTIAPGDEEIEQNNRARSAKLRIAVRI